ncbi:MAG: carboxypeptidase M32, partial [Bacillota bacterium]|nr:carboxypeptidase M32 [Bacillota bacterium]
HIIIRYEIERDLINGVIECEDVPAIWNAKYKEYLGVEVPNDGEGCMQDVHWTDGEIGYFPSYALGNMYGAQIKQTMAKQLDFDKVIADGDLGKIRRWFAENDFCYDYMKPKDWIVKVTGEPLNPQYYIDYLDQKY